MGQMIKQLILIIILAFPAGYFINEKIKRHYYDKRWRTAEW